MSKISIFGVLSNVQMIIHTALKGTRVGCDSLGNTYYRGKPRRGSTQERRWVMYAKVDEATQVPPEWHGWLHHQTDIVPKANNRHRAAWIKPHTPNMTGTDAAYLPPAMKTGTRAAATGDYTPWQPPQ